SFNCSRRERSGSGFGFGFGFDFGATLRLRAVLDLRTLAIWTPLEMAEVRAAAAFTRRVARFSSQADDLRPLLAGHRCPHVIRPLFERDPLLAGVVGQIVDAGRTAPVPDMR